MAIFEDLFGGSSRNERLAAWGRTVPVNEAQAKALSALWWAGKDKRPPEADPLAELSKEDLDYVLKICSSGFRPAKFGNADVFRLTTFRYFKDYGFTAEQSAVLVGMMFNMVGRPDLKYGERFRLE